MSNNKTTYNVSKPSKEYVEVVYDFPVKPDPWTLKRALYDERDGSYLGRTPKAWGQLLLFYIIFYTVLAAFCAICMQGLFASLSDDYPKWQLEESIIGASPSLSFRPILDMGDGDGAIRYKASSAERIKKYVNATNQFLQTYKNATMPVKTKRVPCDYDKPPKQDEVCDFQIDSIIGECGNGSSFGFSNSKPCVFLKLNKIYGWIPEYYNNPADLPATMPEDLVKHIKSITRTAELNQVWVSCKGRKPDTVREVIFTNQRGFPGYYYPFVNQDGYQSPLVAAQVSLEPTQITGNKTVGVECRPWAKNIIYDGSLRDRQGSILIEINIEL